MSDTIVESAGRKSTGRKSAGRKSAIDYPRGLTFEKVWAMFQETDKKFQETEKIIKENAERHKETERLVSKTTKSVKALTTQMGGLHNSFGELAEHLVAPGIVKKFNEIGYNFDSVATKGMKLYGKDKKVKAEIDIVLENGDTIIAVEVKSKVKEKDIDYNIKKLEILREHKRRDTRKILGAIAGAVFGSTEKQASIEAGFYVIEQTGDTMKLDIPEDFIPREW